MIQYEVACGDPDLAPTDAIYSALRKRVFLSLGLFFRC